MAVGIKLILKVDRAHPYTILFQPFLWNDHILQGFQTNELITVALYDLNGHHMGSKPYDALEGHNRFDYNMVNMGL